MCDAVMEEVFHLVHEVGLAAVRGRVLESRGAFKDVHPFERCF